MQEPQQTKKRRFRIAAVLGLLLASIAWVGLAASSSTSPTAAPKPSDDDVTSPAGSDDEVTGTDDAVEATDGSSSTAGQGGAKPKSKPGGGDGSTGDPVLGGADEGGSLLQPIIDLIGGDGSGGTETPGGPPTNDSIAPQATTQFAALASGGALNVVCSSPGSTGPAVGGLAVRTTTDVSGIAASLLGSADVAQATGFRASWSGGSFTFPVQHGTAFTAPAGARFPCSEAKAEALRQAASRGPGEDDCDVDEEFDLDIIVQAVAGGTLLGTPATISITVNAVCPSS